jgi:hypothetical protein
MSDDPDPRLLLWPLLFAGQLKAGTNSRVLKNGSGYGNGYGYSNGSGYGNGNGRGRGNGNGSGNGGSGQK